MAGIRINSQTCVQCGICIQTCPFQALTMEQGSVEVNANCKMCKMCIKACPTQAIDIEEAKTEEINKDDYRNILVYIEHDNESIHPVSDELIGEALRLVKTTHQEVHCLLIGYQCADLAEKLCYSGAKKIYWYDDESLETFKVDSYANLFEDCINQMKPSVCLVGATTTGRSLAPRVATRFKTGLTADCTQLEMRENTDLVQIRPAFGGNIMAQIINTHRRPQFATVRYKVMNAAPLLNEKSGTVVKMLMQKSQLISKIEVLAKVEKEKEKNIAEADILVVAGSAIKDEKGMAMVQELADLLNGMVAVTRPMVEKGLGSIHQQIGLSGRTVKPKLIITCGVSGAIQFVAGMQNSETIIAINHDPEALIFKLAHYAILDDVQEFLPKLISKIKEASV